MKYLANNTLSRSPSIIRLRSDRLDLLCAASLRHERTRNHTLGERNDAAALLRRRKRLGIRTEESVVDVVLGAPKS